MIYDHYRYAKYFSYFFLLLGGSFYFYNSWIKDFRTWLQLPMLSKGKKAKRDDEENVQNESKEEGEREHVETKEGNTSNTLIDHPKKKKRKEEGGVENNENQDTLVSDIEEDHSKRDIRNHGMIQLKKNLNRKQSKELIKNEGDEKEEDTDYEEERSELLNKKNEFVILPEHYKIYFKSFGCAHNTSDSEFMMGLLSNHGFQFVKTIEECDICIVNSCTVKNPSEESMKTIIKYVKKLNKENEFKEKKCNGDIDGLSCSSSDISDIEREICSRQGTQTNGECCNEEKEQKEKKKKNLDKVIKRDNKFENTSVMNNTKNTLPKKTNKNIKIIVCGCVPQAEKNLEIFENVSLVGVNNIDKIIDVVEQVIYGFNVQYLKTGKSMTSLNLPKIRKNKFIEIININNGCLGNCTYCKTKFARGDLVSYPIEQITNKIKQVITEDEVKEIWLTSEDTGAYGIDLNTNIVELLKEILNTVTSMKSKVMIRLGMTNPPYILNHIKEISQIMKHENMYEFIHIPVQSGSNKVLKNMNREYTIEDFSYVVDELRKNVQHVTVATDIICGFPYESDQDHQKTITLIEKYKFPILNISQFYPRGGTVAYNMKRVNTKIVKNRSKEVTNVFMSYENNYEYLNGTAQNVLFTERSLKSEHIIGHTKQYVKVLLENTQNKNIHLLGTIVSCKIISTHKWHVIAELS